MIRINYKENIKHFLKKSRGIKEFFNGINGKENQIIFHPFMYFTNMQNFMP
jgi:hypothetical protein